MVHVHLKAPVIAKEPKHRTRPLALWVMWLRMKALLAQEGLKTWKLYRQTALYEITIYRCFLVQNSKEMWLKIFNVGINCEMSLDDFSVLGDRSSISLVSASLLWQHSSTTDILQEEEDKSWIYHWIYIYVWNIFTCSGNICVQVFNVATNSLKSILRVLCSDTIRAMGKVLFY